MEDFYTLSSNETTCLTTVEHVNEAAKPEPKRSILKNSCVKQNYTKTSANDTTEDDGDVVGNDGGMFWEKRKMSCFSCKFGDTKKDSLTSESEVFEIVHLDASGQVPFRDRLVTGWMKYCSRI